MYVLVQFPQAPDFTGTIINGTISPGGVLEANSTGQLKWNPNPDRQMYSDDTANFYRDTFLELQYIFQVTITAALAGSRMTIPFTSEGSAARIEYGLFGEDPFYTGDDSAAFYTGDDSAAFYSPLRYLPWPGFIEIVQGVYQFRVTIGASANRGRIITLTPTVDVPDREATYAGMAISAMGSRLSLPAPAWNSVVTIQLTLEDDGGDAVTARYVDKDNVNGPLIICLDINDVQTSGTVDAVVQGF